MNSKSGISIVLLGLAASCTMNQRGVELGGSPKGGGEGALTERARQYWNAKVAEDWDQVFECQYEPKLRAKLVRDEFRSWSAENEPLRIHAYSLHRVDTEDNMGWVEIHYHTSIRRYPSVPPRDATMWQKWYRVGREWYPVPVDHLTAYPEAPVHRDAEQEARLRARFAETFRARQASDWPRLYQYTDPKDRGDVTLDMYTDAETQFEYLNCEVHWVEAIREHGRVHVTYHHRLTDKSMEKLSSRDAVITEKWIQRDGEWYRDIKRE